MAQSKRSKEIADLVIAYYLKEYGKVEPVICPYGHPDMVHDVLEQTTFYKGHHGLEVKTTMFKQLKILKH